MTNEVTKLPFPVVDFDTIAQFIISEASNAAALQTGEDRVQTGLDRTQTGQDRVQTGLDRQATEEAAALAVGAAITGLIFISEDATTQYWVTNPRVATVVGETDTTYLLEFS